MQGTRVGCALLGTLVLAAACAPYGAAGSGSARDAAVSPEGTAWSLVELGGQPARGAPNEGTPTLRLDERMATGNTGCNSFAGPYELGGASLRFGAITSTRRACVDEALNRQEAAFMRALDDTRSWRIADGTLVLSGETGVVARFAAR
jgi:heat shock protein HslJ